MQAGRQGAGAPASYGAAPGPYGGVIGNQGFSPGTYRNEPEFQAPVQGGYGAQGGYGGNQAQAGYGAVQPAGYQGGNQAQGYGAVQPAGYQGGEIPPPGVPGAGYREWFPFHGPFDPCPPIQVKTYVIPPNQYIPYQPMGLPQYPLEEALRLGTLWPALYSPYESRCGRS
ncbi:spore coat associated protein CotJA [Paenibacillus sp. RUD330]|nr:spore coat associated protein CotJA [Paenibacillus sp. RUD330]